MKTPGPASVASGNFPQDLALLQHEFERCSDVVYRTFALASGQSGSIVFIEGMVDEKRLEAKVLEPLMDGSARLFAEEGGPPNLSGWIHADHLKNETDIKTAAESVCRGKRRCWWTACRPFCW